MFRRRFLFAIGAAGLSTACKRPVVQDVSLIALIASPRQFDGERVRVIGFLRLAFEENALFVSKADYDARIMKNAVWIVAPDGTPAQGLSDRYVIVEGVFDARKTGHMGMNSGSIRDISRLQRWRLRAQDRAESARPGQGRRVGGE